ncbi:MAG: hypothetical protein IPL32_03335 [Chloracidobacterium sp.]|nr:hypothetical protein [Chloracidobacterium sp.]
MKNEDHKIMEIENDPVRRLLGSMKRVEAPGDFDFHVKARIANGSPVDKSASLLPTWVRYAVPLVLLLFVGGYFGFRAINSPNVATSQPIAAVPVSNIEPPAQATTQVVEPPANMILATQRDEKLPESNTRSKITLPEKLIASTGSAKKNSGDGSFEVTRRISQPIDIRKPKDVVILRSISTKELLMQLGVDAAYSDSSWKVGDVKQNSKAQRSGLKIGDVVEAVNNQILTEKNSFGSPFSSKSIRVRRDGKSVQIELQP